MTLTRIYGVPKPFRTKKILKDGCPIQSAAHSTCHYSSCADVALSLSSSSCFCAENFFFLLSRRSSRKISFLPSLPRRGWKLISLVCSVVASYIHFVRPIIDMCSLFVPPSTSSSYAIICVFARDSAKLFFVEHKVN